MAVRKVAVFVGSLRKESWNRKVATALTALVPASLQMEIVEIGQLPLYNQDSDDGGNPPQAWTEFRPPAMEAGVSDHVWTLEEIAKLAE